MSLEATEAECAANAVAPRVSLKDIEAAIAERHDLIASDILHMARSGVMRSGEYGADWQRLSICLVRLANGWMVIGKSAPASAENFNADLGAKLAYEDAIRQLWPLMGFALRDKLAKESA